MKSTLSYVFVRGVHKIQKETVLLNKYIFSKSQVQNFSIVQNPKPTNLFQYPYRWRWRKETNYIQMSREIVDYNTVKRKL